MSAKRSLDDYSKPEHQLVPAAWNSELCLATAASEPKRQALYTGVRRATWKTAYRKRRSARHMTYHMKNGGARGMAYHIEKRRSARYTTYSLHGVMQSLRTTWTADALSGRNVRCKIQPKHGLQETSLLK